MKSAKDMFVDLGYKWNENQMRIKYVLKRKWFLPKETEIVFYKDTYYKYFLIYCSRISEDELQAINKQIEELGWEVIKSENT